jgi:hypothetical protein
LSPSYKVTLSEKKIVLLRGVASLENNNLLVYYSMYLKFDLIRGMAFGGRGFIKEELLYSDSLS